MSDTKSIQQIMRKLLYLFEVMSVSFQMKAQTVVDIIVGSPDHNTLEAAVYGKPVVFGPNYQKFREAVEMIEAGCAFPVENENDLYLIAQNFLRPDNLRLCSCLPNPLSQSSLADEQQ